jgi:FkbM family methyltransferase
MSFLNFFRRHGRTSYAQSGEDIVVDYLLRGVLRIKRPTYLDIGAHEPSYLSNTYLFYRMGLCGVCVEPNPVLCNRIRRVRPRDKCVNAGVGFSHRADADFYVMNPPTLSTFSSQFKDEALRNPRYSLQKTVRVPLVPMVDIIEEHCSRCPDFISIDVEGLDMELVRDFDFNRYRPAVFCIETTTHIDELKIPGIFEWMHKVDYAVYGDTFINTIFVDRKIWDRRKQDNA